jgi:p-hydroxybenzoate 3-monooxygenase
VAAVGQSHAWNAAPRQPIVGGSSLGKGKLTRMRTQVGIIGAGPAGLFLSHLLFREGIDCVVLEARSRAHIEGRVRAGVLEQGTVDLMRELGLDARLRRDCMVDNALDIRFRDGLIHLDLPALTGGKCATIYGQQEVVKDLVAARLADGAPIAFEAEVVALDGITGGSPSIRYRADGRDETLACDVIAGCDGFHGVSRGAFPDGALTIYDRIFPFGWLGVLSETPPIREMTYINHARGFALCSRRSPRVSRHYLQVAADEDPAGWPDTRFWDELAVRLGEGAGELVTGHIFQKGVTPVRSFVAAPMRHGRLFLAGDAAHIVPPTGAKGLNLAVADVRVLARALVAFFRTGSGERLDRYSDTCLKRIWKTVRYSTYMTRLLHRFDADSPFDRQLQLAELAYVAGARTGQAMIAENYVGLPFEDD